MTKAPWPVTPLESLCGFHNGGTPSRTVPEFFGGDIPWLTGADIRGPLASDCRTYLTEAGIRSSAACRVPKGTILLVTRTSVGKVAVAERELSFSQDITALRPDERRVDTSYLIHFLRTQEKRFQLESRGATIKGITREVLATTRVPLPRVEEQRRIAAILDHADALRAKRRTTLAELETLKQSVFLDMFGNPATNPKGWPTKRLSEIATTTSGGTPARSNHALYGGSIPWVKSGELARELVTHTEEALTTEGLRLSSARLMPKGTVLVALYGATAGQVATLGLEAATNQAVCCISTGPDLLPQYLVLLLRLMMPSFLEGRVGGAQPNLSQGMIRAIPLPLPPLSKQLAFADLARSVGSLTEQVAHASHSHDVLFRSLQHRAFRGEL